MSTPIPSPSPSLRPRATIRCLRVRTRSEPLDDGRPLTAVYSSDEGIPCLGTLRSADLSQIGHWLEELTQTLLADAIIVDEGQRIDAGPVPVLDRRAVTGIEQLNLLTTQLETRSLTQFSFLIRRICLGEAADEIVVCTDGSFYARTRSYGAAAVTTDGQYAFESGHCDSALDAELAAIRLALRVVPYDVKLTLRLDSRDAITLAEYACQLYAEQGMADKREVLRGADDLYSSRRIITSDVTAIAAITVDRRESLPTYKWIKGHSGDLGNDLADRIARCAARGQQMGLPMEDTHSAVRSVISSAGLHPRSLGTELRMHLERQNLKRLCASLSETRPEELKGTPGT